MSKERAAKVMQEIFSKGTYEGDLLGINEGGKMSDTPRTDKLMGDMSAGWHLRWAESHIQLERELAEAVTKERERCALVCERKIDAPVGTYQILMAAAEAIRKGE